MTIPARTTTMRYVHRRGCNTLMSARCRCRLSRRQVYSLAETSHCGLYDSELFIETHLLSRTGSLVLHGPTRPEHGRPSDGIRFSAGGATTRRWVGAAERGETDLVH